MSNINFRSQVITALVALGIGWTLSSLAGDKAQPPVSWERFPPNPQPLREIGTTSQVPGTEQRKPDGKARFKILLEQANLGAPMLEVAELEQQANAASGPHFHQSLELFYVIEGQLTNSFSANRGDQDFKCDPKRVYTYGPGQLAVVPPGAHGRKVMHQAGPEGLKALVIWAPNGEADRLVRVAKFYSKPLTTTAQNGAPK